jgi:pilus assembly protein Flp/PilA
MSVNRVAVTTRPTEPCINPLEDQVREEYMNGLKQILSTFRKDESGQDLIEYALVICILGLGVVATMTNFATTIRTVLGSMGTKLTSSI